MTPHTLTPHPVTVRPEPPLLPGSPIEARTDLAARPQPAGVYRPLKRGMDFAGALVLTIAASPLMLAGAIAVKCSSPGPVLFKQRRVGLDGRHFTVLKFRTMQAGAPSALHESLIRELASDAAARPSLQKLTADPRVTRVGGFLRRWSIDELPQLFNVLSGDMSLVGPRPAIPYELDVYRAGHDERFRVRPGLTGLWQVSGRSQLGLLDMLDLDAEYARRPSLATDLRILAKTPLALVGKTA